MSTQTLPSDGLSLRLSDDAVIAQYELFVGSHCRAIFNAIPSILFALNEYRQIIFANEAALVFTGRSSVREVLGRRPGELLGCLNAPDGPKGCGTSRRCRNCGMIEAILAAMDGAEGRSSCRLLRREQEILEGCDLDVSTSCIELEGVRFLLFNLTDVSHQNRRRHMERIFFHDVLNLAGGINGLVEMLHQNATALGLEQELSVLHSATQSLVDEILSQRELLAAEGGELKPLWGAMETCVLLNQLVGLYSTTPLGQQQSISVAPQCQDVTVVTDARLVQRILGNMLKNALEAGAPGDCVSVGCEDAPDHVLLWVRNAAVMPLDVQDRLFRKSFSTKGDSRGLGTYSMLLLAERYLGGSVDFRSEEGQGTVFQLRLPKRGEKA